MSNNMQVFVRCRPLIKSELNLYEPVEVYPELHKILVRDTGLDKSMVKTFTYDKVFGPETSQAEIYSEVVAPLVEEVIQGFNCTIFAYGQTGTGKTFTIEGGRTPNLRDKSDDPLSGIIPRSMKHLFNELRRQNLKYDVCVSFLELYNEEIFDLLSKTDDFMKLRMYENSSQKGSVIVQGLEVINVKSLEEVYAILEKGCKKRRKAVTLLNKSSSRSHTIFTVTVSCRESSATLQKVKSGKLNLVDLAGSENIGRSGAINKRAREAGNINQSLLALGRVITSLSEKASHIPYRESKLTRLLQDSLGGQTKTAVIATISSSATHIDETLNTLEYALRAKSITNKPELNAHVTVNSIVQDYLEKINTLRTEIYEAGKNGVYASEESIRSWETTLDAKREEKFNLHSQVENLSEEDKALDATILELKKRLEEKDDQLQNATTKNEEYKLQLKQAKEDNKLHENMFNVMQPMHNCVHEKYHKTLEEIKILELESKKKKDAVEEVLAEQRTVRAALDEIRSKHKLWNVQFLKDSENLMSDMRNMNDTVNMMSTDCKNLIDTLKNGFDSRVSDCKKAFEDVSKGVKDLEAVNKEFQKNIDDYLLEEKRNKLKSIEDFEKELSCLSNMAALDPLNQIISHCESSLLSLLTDFKEWRNEATLKMESREKLVSECKTNMKNILESTAVKVKALLNKQMENMEEFNSIVSESLNTESSSRKMVLDKFQAAEEAISSLGIYCIEVNENEVQKTNMVHSRLKNYLEFGKEIVEALSNCSKISVKSMDDMHIEAKNVPDIFSEKWKDLKTIEDSAFSKYKDLTEELERLSKTDENFCEIPDSLRRLLEDIDESIEKIKESKHVQIMADSVMKRCSSFLSNMVKYDMEINASLSKDKLILENLVESSKRLSETTSSNMSHYSQFLKIDLLERFTRMNFEEDITRREASFNGSNTIVSDTTLCIPNNATEISSQDLVFEVECRVCIKARTETFKTDQNTSMAFCKDSILDKAEIPGTSNSFASSFIMSPIRRPRSKSTMAARKNLQFPDIEKLTQELIRRPRSKSTMAARKNLQFPDIEKLTQELLENFGDDGA